MDVESQKNEKIVRGRIFLLFWAVLILWGIVEKRVYGHPDRMMFFHLPAAVFLVLAGYELSYKIRERHRQEILLRKKALKNSQGMI